MVDVPSSEAPLKRKLDSSSGTADICKKSRDSCLAVERAPEDLLGPPGQSIDEYDPAREASLSQDADENLTKPFEEHFTREEIISVDCDLKLSLGALGPSSPFLQELEEVREGEVFAEDESDAEDDSGELSGLDTENDIEDENDDADEEEDEDVGSDEDEEESDYISDNEKDEKLTHNSTSSSSQAEAASKDKGKAKVDDIKGKNVMPLDKGKGKAVMEDEIAPGSDEDDAGYLSEDPLEEVDLNNILPTRTRRRTTTHQYDFVDQGDDDDDDDDSDA